MDDLFFHREHFSISQINQLIREVVNMGFPQAIWVCGEVQGFDRNRDKKHVFFELCEKDAESKDIVARVGLVIFAGRKAYVNEILAKAQNAFQLKDDIEVKFLCRVDFYPPHGAIRLVVESIDPVYTLGKLAQEKQKLIAALKAKGVLDRNKQLLLPEIPLNIGLITSFDSAAYHDFLNELKMSGYRFCVYFKDALMQGKGTEQGVCRALGLLNQVPGLDVIVITRGGGSIADLSWFDSQMIAEKIAASRLPVLSGIGHEINVTVTDLAAHTYQKTPTAIAQYLVEQADVFMRGLDERLKSLLSLAQGHVAGRKNGLKAQAHVLQENTQGFLRAHQERIVCLSERVKSRPALRLLEGRKALGSTRERLLRSLQARVKEETRRVKACAKLIEMASPHKTLKRGFSITRDHTGQLIRTVRGTAPGRMIRSEIADGVLTSEVRSLKNNKEAKRAGNEI